MWCLFTFLLLPPAPKATRFAWSTVSHTMTLPRQNCTAFYRRRRRRKSLRERKHVDDREKTCTSCGLNSTQSIRSLALGMDLKRKTRFFNNNDDDDNNNGKIIQTPQFVVDRRRLETGQRQESLDVELLNKSMKSFQLFCVNLTCSFKWRTHVFAVSSVSTTIASM